MLLSRRESLALIASGTATLIRAGQPARLELASFRADVTIPLGHPCMGGGIDPAKTIADPLEAIGFVLFGVGRPIIQLALDWCELRNDAYDRWRQVLADAVGTTRERVMVSCLHQHDAPIADLAAQKRLDEIKSPGAICDPQFHEQAVQRVAKAARQAMLAKRPITHIGAGKAKVERVASNRRFRTASGTISYGRMSAMREPAVRDAEEGLIDPWLKTLSFWDGDQPLLALSSYATHPMSYYGRGAVSADFVGMARRRRQSDDPTCIQIYVSGCSGNVTAGKYNDGNPAQRPILADRVHSAMKTAWKNTTKRPIVDVAFRSVPLHLEARTSTGFTETDLVKRLKDGPRPFDRCLAVLGLSWRHRVQARQPIDVTALDFGSVVFLLLPAESYVEYQIYAQSIRPDDLVVVSGYGECGPGYIPSERAWNEHDNNLADWCWVDPGSESRMQAAIRAALTHSTTE